MAEQIAIRDAFGQALKHLGGQDPRVVVLDADVGNSSKSILFGKVFPERYFNVGIAELNMTAMACGFAYGGMIPFVNTFASFLTTRASDPIGSLVAYDHLNVKLCGTYCGLSDSYDGASHHSLSDLAFIRTLPGFTIFSVCDATETEWAVSAAMKVEGPVYLRLSRAAVPVLYQKDGGWEVGKGRILRDGSDAAILATGYMVHKALEAADMLEQSGISIRVADIHTIQPIDRSLILDCIQKCGCLLTVEEHSITGGLGSIVTEIVSSESPVLVERMALCDYSESGDYEQLLEKAHLDAASIAARVIQLIKKKNL